jgi:hypothetical protein
LGRVPRARAAQESENVDEYHRKGADEGLDRTRLTDDLLSLCTIDTLRGLAMLYTASQLLNVVPDCYEFEIGNSNDRCSEL